MVRTIALWFYGKFPDPTMAGRCVELWPAKGNAQNGGYRLGRHSGCEIRFTHTTYPQIVSRGHFTIYWDANLKGWFLHLGVYWDDEAYPCPCPNRLWVNGRELTDDVEVDPVRITVGTRIALRFPDSDGRIYVGQDRDDTLGAEVWDDHCWPIFRQVNAKKPLNSDRAEELRKASLKTMGLTPWYASIAVSGANWLQTPETPLGAFWRWIVLVTIGCFIALIAHIISR